MVAPTPTKFTFNPLTGNLDKVLQDAAQIVTVAPSGAMYSSIQDAIDAITDAAANKPYIVMVGPGAYVGNIVLKAFVGLVGVGNGPGAPVIVGSITGSISSSTEWILINRINQSFTVTGDGQKAISGNLQINDFFSIVSCAGDYSFTAVEIDSTYGSGALYTGYIIINNTFDGSTKNMVGLKQIGSGTVNAASAATIQLNCLASSGTISLIENASSASTIGFNNTLGFYNGKASFSGTVHGLNVSAVSALNRTFTNNTVSLIGTSGGTANAIATTSGSTASIKAAGNNFSITGFTTKNSSNTGSIGEVIKSWVHSQDGNYVKAGSGLSVTTPYDLNQTGFVAWSGTGSYFSYNAGTRRFTLSRACVGVYKSTVVVVAAAQYVDLPADFSQYFISADDSGTLQYSTSATFADKILLFSIYSDGTYYTTAKQTHVASFPADVSRAWHQSLGSSMTNDANGVLTLLSGAGRTVKLVGTSTYYDHGLETTIADSVGAAISMQMVYTGVSGITYQGAAFTAIPAVRQNGTSLSNTANGKFVNYRVGVMPNSNADDTTANQIAQYIIVPDSTEHNSASAAAAQITANAVAAFPAAIGSLEAINLAYVTIQGDGAGTGTLTTVTPAKQVFGVNFASGATSSAGTVTTDISNFSDELSTPETSVQLALDRLDDYDSLLVWGTGKLYRVGNVVRVTTEGFIGEWRCVSAHTAAAAVTTDINTGKWEIVANSEGSRELVNSAGHGFAAGNVLYSNAGTYAKAKADAAATAEVIGVVTGATTDYFVLAKTGKVTKTGWALTAGSVYFLSDSAIGQITATEPTTVGYISKPVGIAVSTTALQVFNMRGTTVGGTNLYTTISLANNATTTIQDVSGHSAGTGGFIEGYIKIDGGAGEDNVTTFKVEFQKPASGTAYSCTVTYGCEALFAGSSIDITTGGLIQVTLGDVGGDFVSASATFCMQAAAIGAQLPLQINSSSITYSEPLMFRNMLINGCMRVVQRGTSFDSTTLYPNNDATYLLDRWYILSDGNDVVDVTQQTDAPSLIATSKCIRLDVETANKKFGIAQKIEADSCSQIIGGSVTLSFYAKVSATTNLDNVKCAIVSWSGTADSVTSDIVSAWEIEGTNPTLIANATYENTPANLGVTTSWARYTVTAAVDTASTKQLVLFIWSDVTTTSAGEFLYITGAQLEKGTSVTPFEFRPFSTELALCQRYFEKSYAASVTPGTSTTAGATALEVLADGTLTRLKLFRSGFAVHKRVSPDIKWYSETGTADSISVYSDSATTKTVSSTTGTINSSVGYYVTVSTNAVAAQTYVGHWTASAEL